MSNTENFGSTVREMTRDDAMLVIAVEDAMKSQNAGELIGELINVRKKTIKDVADKLSNKTKLTITPEFVRCMAHWSGVKIEPIPQAKKKKCKIPRRKTRIVEEVTETIVPAEGEIASVKDIFDRIVEENEPATLPSYVYFKDLGKFRILSREKEVIVASQIKTHKKGIKRIIFSSLVVLDELVACLEKLKSGQIRLENVVSPETSRWFASENVKREMVKTIRCLRRIQERLAAARQQPSINHTSGFLEKRLHHRQQIFKGVESINFNLGFLERLAAVFESQVNGSSRLRRPLNEIAQKLAPDQTDYDLTDYLFAEELPEKDLTTVRKRLRWLTQELEKAKQKMIESNMRLVVSIARKHMGRGMEFMDLIQEGNDGLIKAIDKFDHVRGFKFGTYASWWIRQAITRAISEHAKTIRTPMYLNSKYGRVAKVTQKLLQKLGRKPDVEEIAEETGMTVEKVIDVLEVIPQTMSLSKPIGDDQGNTLENLVADEKAASFTGQPTFVLVQDHLDNVLQTLTIREEEVIRLRFGLSDGLPKTLEEIGLIFDLTRERIRQIEAKALKKLRHKSRSKPLRQVAATFGLGGGESLISTRVKSSLPGGNGN